MLAVLLAESATSEWERLADKFGVPLVIAVGLAVVLYRVLWHLASKHVSSLERRDVAFEKMSAELPTICKAQCPKAQECANFRPLTPA